MSERDYAPLSMACVRGLCDKFYDKRKVAGSEVEKMAKEFSDANNTNQIKKLINVLARDMMSSATPNMKIGALMGLSSLSVGLGKNAITWLEDILLPMVACTGETEPRVRYQAVESLYNIVKVARGAALAHFAALLAALAHLVADPDAQVRRAAEMLDRLLKDIVSESEEVGAGVVASVVGALRERAYGRGAGARQFALGWVAVLDARPRPGLLKHLPDLLDPLLVALDDPNPEIRTMCEAQLNEFLRGLKEESSSVELPTLINVLAVHAQSPAHLTKLTSLRWLREVTGASDAGAARHAAAVLAAALPALAISPADHPHAQCIRETATALNIQLMRQAGSGEWGSVKASALVGVLGQLARHPSPPARLAALAWLSLLHKSMTQQMEEFKPMMFECGVACVADAAPEVARAALALLADLCAPKQGEQLKSNPYFEKLVRSVVQLLATDEALLDDRGAFVIREMCAVLSAEEVYLCFSRVLGDEQRLSFAARAVDALTTILFTAAELYELRRQLRRFDDAKSVSVFERMYACWWHSPAALLALCLLSRNYAHCETLVQLFGEQEVTVEFLAGLDKLVQLIESPIFAYLRLELVRGESQELRRALYGLLMLLPQSDAFHALRTRLQCAPPLSPRDGPITSRNENVTSHNMPVSSSETPIVPTPDWPRLLDGLKKVQEAHRRLRLAR